MGYWFFSFSKENTQSSDKQVEYLLKQGDALLKNHEYKKAIEHYRNVLKIDSKNARAYAQLGSCIEVKQPLNALKFYFLSALLEQKFLMPRLRIAELCFYRGLFEKALKYARQAYTISKNKESFAILMAVEITLGNRKKVKQYLKENADNNNTPLLLYTKAMICYQEGKFKEARSSFEQLKDDKNLAVFAHIGQAYIFEAKNKLEQALKTFQSPEYYNHFFVKFELLRYYYRRRFIKKARNYCESLLKEILKDPFYPEMLVRSLLQYRETDLALKVALEALKYNENNFALHILVAKIYKHHKLFSKVKKHCMSVISSYKGFAKEKVCEAYRLLGNVYVLQKEYKLAIVQFHSLVKKMPQNPTGHKFLADAYFKNKQYSKALTYYQKALALAPETEQFYLNIAQVYLAMEQWNDAVKIMNDRLKLDPNSFASRNFLAMLYQKMNKMERAKTLYKEIIKKFPRQAAIAYNNLANILEKEGKIKKALVLAIKSCQLSKNHPFPLDTLAWLWYKDGQYEKSKKLLEKLVQALPRNLSIRYHYASVLGKLKDARALREWEIVLRLAPQSFYAKEARKRIEEFNKK